MYEMGGRAYVYLCYGIHNLFNVVTNEEGMADAVLIRALEPIEGWDIMRTRTNKKTTEARLASGPGLVGKAMAFNTNQTGELLNDKIWVGRKLVDARREIVSAKRIGVDYAGEDANLMWRFYEKGNRFVSRQ